MNLNHGMVPKRRVYIRRRTTCLLRYLAFPLSLIVCFMVFHYNSEIELPDWRPNISRNISDYIFPQNKTTIFEPHLICRDKLFLLITVCSATQHFDQRQIIRKTWGNTTEFNYNMFAQMHAHLKGQYLEASEKRLKLYANYLNIIKGSAIQDHKIPVRVVFIIGRKKSSHIEEKLIAMNVKNEFEQYGDIVQEDFIDSYNNLTLKTMFALKWITKHCVENCAFIMKCDDDTFINIPNVLHFLLGGTIPVYNDTIMLYNRQEKSYEPHRRLKKTNKLLVGHRFSKSDVELSPLSKWYMPKYMYAGKVYPTFLSGSGYVMSSDVVRPLYTAALNTSLVHLEDVYLTGICAEKAGIKPMHEPLFYYDRLEKLCSLKGSITQHTMTYDKLLRAYAFVTNLKKVCGSP